MQVVAAQFEIVEFHPTYTLTMTNFDLVVPQVKKHSEVLQGIYTWYYQTNQIENFTIMSLL